MSSRSRGREFSVFSMSFLDTICCAFGAIILLFVLSKFGEPQAHEKAREDLKGQVLKLQQELEEVRARLSCPRTSSSSRSCAAT